MTLCMFLVLSLTEKAQKHTINNVFSFPKRALFQQKNMIISKDTINLNEACKEWPSYNSCRPEC